MVRYYVVRVAQCLNQPMKKVAPHAEFSTIKRKLQ